MSRRPLGITISTVLFAADARRTMLGSPRWRFSIAMRFALCSEP